MAERKNVSDVWRQNQARVWISARFCSSADIYIQVMS